MAHLKDKYEYWDVDATPPGLEVLWKIVSPADLAKWQEAGGISGSELDRKDGFIHTSNGRMVREVAARFFKGVGDAVLLKMLPEEWPLAVIWSPDEPVGVLKRPVGLGERALAPGRVRARVSQRPASVGVRRGDAPDAARRGRRARVPRGDGG